jgi:hypothetical protein
MVWVTWMAPLFVAFILWGIEGGGLLELLMVLGFFALAPLTVLGFLRAEDISERSFISGGLVLSAIPILLQLIMTLDKQGGQLWFFYICVMPGASAGSLLTLAYDRRARAKDSITSRIVPGALILGGGALSYLAIGLAMGLFQSS